MNRHGWTFAAALVAVAGGMAVQGCSTSSRETATRTPTLIRTATQSPTNTRTFTHTYTNTPNVTATPTPCMIGCSPNWSWYGVLTTAGVTNIYPQQTPQTSGPVNLVGGDCWQFVFCAESGTTYWFSACTNGGSYASDSVFEIFDQACSPLLMNDDTCGYGSELSWTASFSGPATLGVTEYSNGPETVTLAYWRQ